MLLTVHWLGLQTTLGFEQAGRVEQPQTPPLEVLLMQPHMFCVEVFVL